MNLRLRARATRGAAPRARVIPRALVFACLCALFAAGVRAQSAATLSGTVVDEMGAVVVAASVTVSNPATGLQRQLLTNEEGYFVFPLLPPATYAVRVEREGFAPVEIPDASLGANSHVAYRVRLKVGGVGGYVVVEDALAAEGPGALGTSVDRKMIESLPLNGRSLQALLELAPGVVLTRTTFNEQGQFSVNGQRASSNYFAVDGVSADFGVSAGGAPGQAAAGALPALAAFGGTNNLVSLDALQEVRVQTSTYAPEFGRSSGAQVSLVTRAGSNEFHGSLFEYFGNDALDSNDFFARSRNLPKPKLRQNDFGGVLGGRLVKDRAFFFASYEGLRFSEPRVVITESPNAFVRENAPAALRPFLNAFPRPNRVGFSSVPTWLNEFAATYSDPARLDAASLRLDANVRKNLLAFARYSRAPSESVQRGRGFLFGTTEMSLSTLDTTSSETQTATAGATWIVSAKASDDLRVNWSRADGASTLSLDDFGGAIPFRAELFTPPGVSADSSALQFVVAGGIDTSLGVGRLARNSQRQLNVVDTLSLDRASHQLKFGADYRRLAPIYNPAGYSQRVIFPVGPAAGASPDLIRAKASQVEVRADAGTRFPVFVNFSAFAQDTWRAGARLTLTYGARWELSPPPAERRGNRPFHLVNFDGAAARSLAPPGSPLWRTAYGNFAPRVGASYQLSRRAGTVVRGGLGVYYDTTVGPSAQVFGSVQPYASVRRMSGVSFPLTTAQAAPAQSASAPPFETIYAFDPNLKTPYSLEWNVTAEQQLGARQTLSAAYVASAGRRLIRQGLLAPDATFREVRLVNNAASSDYRALQINFRRRLARGFQALASYTWSRSLDNVSEDSTVSGGLLPPAPAPSDFDVRHSASSALGYDLRPLKKGRLMRALVGDSSLDAIFRARTATPVNVFVGSNLLTGDRAQLILPDVIAGVPVVVNDPSAAGGRRVNRDAFSTRPTGSTLGRNSLRGFGMWQLDLSLGRRFAVNERASVRLRAEVYNVLNHPNFGNPVGDLGSSFFGQSIQSLGASLGAGGVNGGLSPVFQIGGARSAQLAVKFQF